MIISHDRIMHQIPKLTYKFNMLTMQNQQVPITYTHGAVIQNLMHANHTAD